MTNFNFFGTIKSFFSAYNRCVRTIKRAERRFNIEVSADQWGRLYDLVNANPHKLIRIREHVLFESGSMIPNRIYVGEEYVSLETRTINMDVHGLTDLAGLEITPSKTTVIVRTALEKAALEHGGDCLLGYYRTDELIEARRLRDSKTEIVLRQN